ncbi:hypothetical protein RD110_25900 [Rhodoferax koreense]|uniref:Uncharacterized protein n=1 Tax=Rhodoferax koreensis TaxID=1842727 RepID=A0A1P8K2J6_9BURK|nr:hypothetical protein [Rhodoferax koreense]APW40207.1 hypothetical protein RD110_25900 [Rhodoferax koreense]
MPPALERLNYFAGQILSVADLQAEQDYFLRKLRRHNRHQHGWGVVSGLAVHIDSGAEVVVAPGFAVDCAGNEIELDTPWRLPIPSVGDLQFVVLRYEETLAAPAPAGLDGVNGDTAFGRIREGLQIEIVTTDPGAGHSGRGTGTPGCGQPHGLCIARLKRSPRGWKLALKGRR